MDKFIELANKGTSTKNICKELSIDVNIVKTLAYKHNVKQFMTAIAYNKHSMSKIAECIRKGMKTPQEIAKKLKYNEVDVEYFIQHKELHKQRWFPTEELYKLLEGSTTIENN